MMSAAPFSRLKKTASGALLWLAVPLMARAASFDEVFNGIPAASGPASASSLQTAITELFNNRIYVWLVYAVSVASIFGIFYGAFVYVTAGGDAAKAATGRKSIIYSILGIAVLALTLTIIAASGRVGTGVVTNNARGAL